MPTAIPNFLRGQSPLGAAFANLANTISSGPSDAERYQAADNALLTHRKVQGQQGIADFFRNNYGQQPQAAPPAVNVPQQAPVAMPAPEPMNDGGMPVGPAPAPSPIAQAFSAGAPQAPNVETATVSAPKLPPGPNWGEGIANAIYAGMNPKDLGGYNLFGAANQFGATDQRTQNAQVGDGQTYENTYGALDRKQTDEMTKADNLNATSRANNAATQATSRANNHDTNARIAAAVGAEGAPLDPATVSYLAEQVRNGAPLPALGMGKQAAAMRSAILQEAAREDLAAGRDGTDAAIARSDYAGHLSGSRVLGNREATTGTAVNELAGIIPTTKALIGSVARTGLYPMDVILNAAQHGTNDPQLAKLAVSINDAVNAHARAINPQGQVTDAGRKQGYDLLNQVQSPEAMGGALDQMMIGAQRALAAPGQTRGQMHDAQRGVLGGKEAPAAAAPAAEERWVRGSDGKLQRAQ